MRIGVKGTPLTVSPSLPAQPSHWRSVGVSGPVATARRLIRPRDHDHGRTNSTALSGFARSAALRPLGPETTFFGAAIGRIGEPGSAAPLRSVP